MAAETVENMPGTRSTAGVAAVVADMVAATRSTVANTANDE